MFSSFNFNHFFPSLISQGSFVWLYKLQTSFVKVLSFPDLRFLANWNIRKLTISYWIFIPKLYMQSWIVWLLLKYLPVFVVTLDDFHCCTSVWSSLSQQQKQIWVKKKTNLVSHFLCWLVQPGLQRKRDKDGERNKGKYVQKWKIN